MKDLEFRSGPILPACDPGTSDWSALRFMWRWNTGRLHGAGVISRKLTVKALWRPECFCIGVVWNKSLLDSIVQVFLLPCIGIRIHLVSSKSGHFASPSSGGGEPR